MLGWNEAILFKDMHEHIKYLMADTQGCLDVIQVSIHEFEDPGFTCEDWCMVEYPFRIGHEAEIVVVYQDRKSVV